MGLEEIEPDDDDAPPYLFPLGVALVISGVATLLGLMFGCFLGAR